jgi:hypothetical protein
MRIGTLIVAAFLIGQVAQLPAPTPYANESVDVRYARAQLKLAEANLNRVEQSNKQVERAVPSSIVAEYQRDVEVAKTRLAGATADHSPGEFQVWLERADAERRAAETTWKSATSANASVPATFSPLDIKRYRLRAEVAKLQLERGQKLANSSRESQLQWELEVLDNQVQRLKEESRQPLPFPESYPYWW